MSEPITKEKAFCPTCDILLDEPVCGQFEMMTDENGIPLRRCDNCSHAEKCHE
jgi:hypothetical protein